MTEVLYQYPEYRAFEQHAPTGFLPSDQTHKLRLWATYTLATSVGNFTFSALERFDSGVAFSAIGQIDPTPYLSQDVLDRYSNDPGTVNYFFGERGGYRFDDVNALDLSVNYRLRLGRAELFLQPEIINVMNENAQFTGRTTVFTVQNDETLQPFNPFTETPVEGVHYEFHPDFGKARNANDYQLARTYRFSLGLRF